MKRSFLLLLSLGSVASAVPLLGTPGSFFESGLCRTYRCSLSSRESLGGGVVDFRYTLAPERAPQAGEIPEAGPTLSVIRVNNVVTSLGYAQGAQDTLLYPGSYLLKLLSRTFTFAAGSAVSEATLRQLEGRCGEADGQQVEVKVPVGRFTLSCVNSYGEYTNARRVAFRLYR
ncbi:hypothetical protein [Deinococcus hopiensis]|uniref:Uncharacterized protein n=1 Tax=Deinococcus hopiensis KR-140 TaxID=695939 RepID=A0A1W1VUI9_9DEIO|nr:hypothetical protein [Deinococcus hopiensis]SMB97035.1 hypothetical protein SAMN00790413_06305 [Deinococcus hopiensis KR-140]